MLAKHTCKERKEHEKLTELKRYRWMDMLGEAANRHGHDTCVTVSSTVHSPFGRCSISPPTPLPSPMFYQHLGCSSNRRPHHNLRQRHRLETHTTMSPVEIIKQISGELLAIHIHPYCIRNLIRLHLWIEMIVFIQQIFNEFWFKCTDIALNEPNHSTHFQSNNELFMMFPIDTQYTLFLFLWFVSNYYGITMSSSSMQWFLLN